MSAISMHDMLQSMNDTSFGNLGSVVSAREGRWIVGGESLFPLQIERLAEDNRFMVYSSAVRSTAEPVYVSLMKTMFIENLRGMSLGRYGICVGPVTITVYQWMKTDPHFSHEQLAATIACHRMLMDCYLEGDADVEELIPANMLSMLDETMLPFKH